MHFFLPAVSAAFLRPLAPSPSIAYSVGDSSTNLRAVMRGGGGGGVSVGGAVGSPVAAQVDVWNWRDGTGKGTSFGTLVAEAKRAHKSRHRVEVHVGADSAVDRVSHTPRTSKGYGQPPTNHHRPPVLSRLRRTGSPSPSWSASSPSATPDVTFTRGARSRCRQFRCCRPGYCARLELHKGAAAGRVFAHVSRMLTVGRARSRRGAGAEREGASASASG